MVDPGTGIVGGLALLGGKDLLNKLLGPTAEYLGGELRSYSEKGFENLKRVFLKATKRLGTRMDAPGGVPPKVLKNILSEGYYCEDELSAEYFGGVLASSRSEINRDDRGATYISMISTLSTFQIRTHYIFYTLLRTTFSKFSSTIKPGLHREIMCAYIPTADYYLAMDLDSDFPKEEDKFSILTHSVNGLRRLDLVFDLSFGKKELFLQDQFKYKFGDFPIEEEKLAEHGIAFCPTPLGMELYLWVHGLGRYPHQQFLNPELTFDPIADIKLPNKARILYERFINAKFVS